MAEFPLMKKVIIGDRVEYWPYPQHKVGEDEYVETGHDNPLPTAGYGMTKSGVWIPKRVDDEGNTLTQVTGSIVEDAIPTESVGRKVEYVEVLERGVRIPSRSSNNAYYMSSRLDIPLKAKKIVILCKVYGLTGDFEDDEGYRFDLRNSMHSNLFTGTVFESKYTTTTSNGSGASFEMGEGVAEYNMNDKFIGKPVTPLQRVFIYSWLKGEFNDGEGLDFGVDAYIYY